MTTCECLGVLAVVISTAGMSSAATTYLHQPMAADSTIAIPVREVVHPVSWFLAHPAELAATMRRCDDSPAVARASPECGNAQAASGKVEGEKIRQMLLH